MDREPYVEKKIIITFYFNNKINDTIIHRHALLLKLLDITACGKIGRNGKAKAFHHNVRNYFSFSNEWPLLLCDLTIMSQQQQCPDLLYAIREMAITLFRDVSKEKEFKNCSTNVKQSLALCCLYVICNQESNHITFSELFKNSDSVFKHVGKILLRLQKKRPEFFEKGSKKIEPLVPLYLFKHDFADKEKMTISDYATGLVWMWQEACLIQGLNPITVIYVALFYAWKAVNQKRSSITINEFCNQYDFAKYCPLLINSKELTKNTVSLQIEKIVSMKRLIIAQYNQNNTYDQQVLTEQKNDDTDDSETLPTKRIAFKKWSEDNIKEDQDLSEEEINSYIRTDREVEVYFCDISVNCKNYIKKQQMALFSIVFFFTQRMDKIFQLYEEFLSNDCDCSSDQQNLDIELLFEEDEIIDKFKNTLHGIPNASLTESKSNENNSQPHPLLEQLASACKAASEYPNECFRKSFPDQTLISEKLKSETITEQEVLETVQSLISDAQHKEREYPKRMAKILSEKYQQLLNDIEMNFDAIEERYKKQMELIERQTMKTSDETDRENFLTVIERLRNKKELLQENLKNYKILSEIFEQK
ncbi:Transcription factor IIIB 50 kDa subunit [Dermatophagoides pteronyssinus]|uniref:Transcription factor IIIB 50 kDa subunit n=2 Tax=Dermatophagoides pteronyssinus TaxID=6956 RepID=A0ABQ8IS08_DERPT|nr:Transcription factor IIIB 50 kDa subunit [Dermatophagoides pteronyssinus]